MKHSINIMTEFMEAKLAGEKLFEIRVNDRNYQVGDTVEYLTKSGVAYRQRYEITYITDFEQKDGWVVFGERALEMETTT